LTTAISIGPLKLELRESDRLPPLLHPFEVEPGERSVTCLCRRGPVQPAQPELITLDSGGIWCLERHPRGERLLLRRGGPGGRAYQQLLLPADGGPAEARIDPRLLGPEQPGNDFALREPLLELWACRLLAERSALLLHAAAVRFGRELWLFAGQSGAGKSTICRLLDRAGVGRVLCDDRVIVQPRPDGWWAWSTPWHGEARFSRPGQGRLARIFFLQKSPSCLVTDLPFAEGLVRLLGCVFSLEWSAGRIERIMDRGTHLLRQVAAQLLSFTPDEALVQLLRQDAGKRVDR